MTTVSVNPEIDASMSADSVHYDVNGSLTTYRTYPATSWSSNNLKYSVIPPSTSVYMNRCIQEIIPIQIVYTGTTTSTYLLDDGYDALRSLADMRIKTTSAISINGSAFPVSTLYDLYPDILLHYNREYRERHPLSAIDMTSEYSSMVGANSNPLSSYSTSTNWQGGMLRGSYTLTSINRVSNAGNPLTVVTTTINVNLISWLYLPALLGLDCSKEMGLIRIRNFDVDTTFNTDPSRCISHATGGASTITSCTVTVLSQPYLLTKFITPPVEMIPSGTLKYRHLRLERYVTAYGANCATGSDITITGNNIQLPNIPRFLFVWCREADSYKTYQSTDSFMAMKNISIMFNNQASLLSTATPYDLWHIARECGSLDALQQFIGKTTTSGFTQTGTCGSVFCAEFGRHISLGDGSLAIGSAGSFNFNVITTVNNQAAATINNPTLYCVIAYDQDLIINENGQVTMEVPLVPVGQIASGDIIKVPYQTDGIGGVTYGGSFRSAMKKMNDWLKKTKVISKVGNIVAPMLPPSIGMVAKQGLNMADKLGYGNGTMSQSELRNKIKNL